jgi:hypothetical protein
MKTKFTTAVVFGGLALAGSLSLAPSASAQCPACPATGPGSSSSSGPIAPKPIGSRSDPSSQTKVRNGTPRAAVSSRHGALAFVDCQGR